MDNEVKRFYDEEELKEYMKTHNLKNEIIVIDEAGNIDEKVMRVFKKTLKEFIEELSIDDKNKIYF